MKFQNSEKALNNFPAEGQSTLSGIRGEGDPITGLAKKGERFIYGGVLNY